MACVSGSASVSPSWSVPERVRATDAVYERLEGMCEVGRGEPGRMGRGVGSQLFFIAMVSGVQDSQAKVDMNPDMDAGRRGLCD